MVMQGGAIPNAAVAKGRGGGGGGGQVEQLPSQVLHSRPLCNFLNWRWWLLVLYVQSHH